MDGTRMVCFGDELPEDAEPGRPVFVTVHEIAGGPAVVHLTGAVRDLDRDDVDSNAVLDLLDHVSLGRNADEVAASIERHRSRRLVALVEDS
jgi:hypothetical protein